MSARPPKLAKKGYKYSTYVIHAVFTDESNQEVPPDSIKWSLFDSTGAVVNGKQNVAVTPPAAVIDVVLAGLDLPAGELDFLSEAVYDSDLVTNSPLKKAVSFDIIDLPWVTSV